MQRARIATWSRSVGLAVLSLGLMAGAASTARAQGGPIARTDTFIATGQSSSGSPTFSQYNDFNPFRPGLDKRASVTHVLEGLYYYNVLKDEMIPWLAKSFEYNSDYTAVTVNLREGIKWSDGEKFGVDDVIYTISMLQANGKGKADLFWADDMARDVKELVRLNDYTVRIELTHPDPRWFFTFFAVRFSNQGIHIVPKHIYETVDRERDGQLHGPRSLQADLAGRHRRVQGHGAHARADHPRPA